MVSGRSEPVLVDSREHRFQLGVVGTLAIGLALVRRPTSVMALALVTAAPVLPQVFRRVVAPRVGSPAAVEDARLPAFARVAGGAVLAMTAVAARVVPCRTTYALLYGSGAVCVYGAATGRCVPCSVLMSLEKVGMVELDPPLVCSLPGSSRGGLRTTLRDGVWPPGPTPRATRFRGMT